MDGIRHSKLRLNGINVHVAESGPTEGAVILFLHGFPELWYSWRHQMAAVASLGYRAVAPDLRGYGDTDAPEDPGSYTVLHVVGDLVALIEAVAPSQGTVFVVGHGWGAAMAWHLCLMRPDKVKAAVNLSVPFGHRSANRRPMPSLKAYYGEDYYSCRFQEPGVMEAEFAEHGTERVLKEFFTLHTPDPLFLPKGRLFGHSLGAPIPLPPWLSEADLKYFTYKYEKTSFTGGLNYFRNVDRNWELTAPWQGDQVKVPVKFVAGDQDMAYNNARGYIHKGGFKRDVPFLQEVVVMEGVGHFLQEEKADEISGHIIDFIRKFG
ncbi:unnamed protein product [Linum tenue]|uniref:soluble epoxide hydrolase n=1 Tax=Linum tenue TaxID=586396 RepID=A0AAV0S4H5_9ROSI|nr:unnamed protein product [Linum tenue]